MEDEREGTPEIAPSEQYDFEPVQPYLDSEDASTIVERISTLFNQLHEETAHLLDGSLQDPNHTNAKARCDEFLAYLSGFTSHRKRDQECPGLIARIMLGSVIEYSLQLFLLSFEEDYRSTLSEKWSEKELTEIKSTFTDCLANCPKSLNSNKRRAIKGDLESLAERHSPNKPIDKVMLGELTSFAAAHIFKPSKTEADENLSSSANGYRALIESLFKTISSDRNLIHPLAQKQSTELAMIDLLKGAMALLNEMAYRVHCKGRGQTALDILKSSGMPIVAYDISEDLHVYAVSPDQQPQSGTAE